MRINNVLSKVSYFRVTCSVLAVVCSLLVCTSAQGTTPVLLEGPENDGDGIEGSYWAGTPPPANPPGVTDPDASRYVTMTFDNETAFKIKESMERGDMDRIVDNFKPEGSRYVVYGDCGSTGTRLHIYRVDDPAKDEEGDGVLEGSDFIIKEVDVVKKPKVPLSGFVGFDADQVWASLAPLFVAVENKLPVEHHKHTAVHLMATAGMRLVGTKEREAVEKAVREAVEKNTAFRPVTVRTISGEEEGFFGWIAVNYLNGLTFKKFPLPYSDLLQAVGALDLGGGSAQVVGMSMEMVRLAHEASGGLSSVFDNGKDAHEAATSSAAAKLTKLDKGKCLGKACDGGEVVGRRRLRSAKAIAGVQTMRDLFSQLYIRTYLGVGAMQFYEELKMAIALPQTVDPKTRPNMAQVLRETGRAECHNVLHVRKDLHTHLAEFCHTNPCAFNGTSHDIEVEGGMSQERDHNAVLGAMTNIKGTGQFDQCLRLARAALRDKQLSKEWYRPGYTRDTKTGAVDMQLPGTLGTSWFTGISLFYHTTHFLDVVKDLIETVEGQKGAVLLNFPRPTLRHIAEAGRRLCRMNYAKVMINFKNRDPNTPEDRLWGRCFDTVLVTALLGGHDDPDQDAARRAEILAYPDYTPPAGTPNYGVPIDPHFDPEVMGIPEDEVHKMVPPPPPPAWPAKPKPFVGFGLLQDAGNVMFMDEVASKEVDGKTVEVEWTLGALVFDLRDGTEGATSLIGKVPGGGSTNFASGFALTLREFLVGFAVVVVVGAGYTLRSRGFGFTIGNFGKRTK